MGERDQDELDRSEAKLIRRRRWKTPRVIQAELAETENHSLVVTDGSAAQS
jgi:hypothetical protein